MTGNNGAWYQAIATGIPTGLVSGIVYIGELNTYIVTMEGTSNGIHAGTYVSTNNSGKFKPVFPELNGRLGPIRKLTASLAICAVDTNTGDGTVTKYITMNGLTYKYLSILGLPPGSPPNTIPTDVLVSVATSLDEYSAYLVGLGGTVLTPYLF